MAFPVADLKTGFWVNTMTPFEELVAQDAVDYTLSGAISGVDWLDTLASTFEFYSAGGFLRCKDGSFVRFADVLPEGYYPVYVCDKPCDLDVGDIALAFRERCKRTPGAAEVFVQDGGSTVRVRAVTLDAIKSVPRSLTAPFLEQCAASGEMQLSLDWAKQSTDTVTCVGFVFPEENYSSARPTANTMHSSFMVPMPTITRRVALRLKNDARRHAAPAATPTAPSN